MIASNPNVEILRGIDEAMVRGDMAAFFGAHTDDVVAHLGGHSRLAGDYRGVAEVQGVFGKFMEAAGEYSFENHAYLADDEHGVIMQKGTFRKDGRTLTTDEVFVVHFRDGKIAEFWYIPVDQAGVDAWFGS